ncbi:MAG: Na+/H+ antiporter NhaA [Tepidiformaceae bacterium]
MTEPKRSGLLAFVQRRLLLPVQTFIHTETSSGILLLIAAAVAIIWVNSPWDSSYFDLWHTQFTLDFWVFQIDEDLGHLVNDGLMAIFFFVVGLEIKREVLHGELASPRRAALPVAAALGGMIVPATIYAVFNAGGDGAAGWGIPMATDIAFALGVLALLGRRAPFALKVFLLALAIADDLGAIMVIAVFYTDSLSLEALAWAGVLIAVILASARAGIHATNFYVLLGALFWLAVLESGIHATVAGVILAFLTPATARLKGADFAANAELLLDRHAAAKRAGSEQQEQVVLQEFERLSEGFEAPLERLERVLHPWTSFIIVPIFALANAGVVVSSDAVSSAVESPVTLGVFFGLVVGKPLGILAFAWLAVRSGIASLPTGIGFGHITGAGLLGGIGFTVSLFITGLAFDSAQLVADGKMGILAASLIAGAIGFTYLWILPGQSAAEDLAKQAAKAHSGH